MSSAEFSEWMLYHEVNPFTEGRADWRAAMLASVIVSVVSGKQHGVDEFMPKFQVSEAEGKNWEAQLAMVEMLNAAFGGADLRNGER